jgi:hypothetical protein
MKLDWPGGGSASAAPTVRWAEVATTSMPSTPAHRPTKRTGERWASTTTTTTTTTTAAATAALVTPLADAVLQQRVVLRVGAVSFTFATEVEIITHGALEPHPFDGYNTAIVALDTGVDVSRGSLLLLRLGELD